MKISFVPARLGSLPGEADKCLCMEHNCAYVSLGSGKCLDFAKIVKHENGVTVLLTSASYQVLTGQPELCAIASSRACVGPAFSNT